MEKHPSWKVFGSVQNQGFDPLAFAHEMGGYDPKNQKNKLDDGAGWISKLPAGSMI